MFVNLKILSTEFQQVVMGMKREHRESLEKIERGHEVSLFNMRGETASKLCQYEDKIRQLEEQVEKLQKELTATQVCKRLRTIS